MCWESKISVAGCELFKSALLDVEEFWSFDVFMNVFSGEFGTGIKLSSFIK